MIDEVDRKILDEYLEDSRQSYREIARKTDLSPGTVAARVAKMEEKGIIKKYTIQVDHEKLGYDLTVLINVRIGDASLFFDGGDHELTKLPEPCAIYNITGDHDMTVIAKFKTRAELSNFIKKLLSLPYIKGTTTHLALMTLKEDFNKI
ncbi:MAG: Lrp/AsnC family transcriptional regulator [Candidatus Bathyarchaeota archaeon]|nr:Lrp/AsnC family transcriptional regulator [Candidatus Bathyarchaeota archaeon]